MEITANVENTTEKRVLASIVEIEGNQPIVDADRIVITKMKDKSWNVITKKGEFNPGDRAVYVEIDGILPDGMPTETRELYNSVRRSKNKAIHESQEWYDLMSELEELRKLNLLNEFEFLADKKFRIKTLKIRGTYSQGILFSFDVVKSVLGKLGKDVNLDELPIDYDVTDLMNITKFEEPQNAIIGGKGKDFPGYIMRTDEKRVENLSKYYERLKQYRYVAFQKMEGSSFTAAWRIDKDTPEGRLVVCSHNREFKDLEENDSTFVKMAYKYKLDEILKQIYDEKGLQLSLQAEMIGEGIQKNIYKIRGHELAFFCAFDINKQRYMDVEDFISLIREYELPLCPIDDEDFELPETVEELLEMADRLRITYGRAKDILSEGYVLVAKNVNEYETITRGSLNRVSMKIKSRPYLLKFGG